MILMLSANFGWLPSLGRGDVEHFGWWSTALLSDKNWSHIIMPTITLAIFQLPLIMGAGAR